MSGGRGIFLVVAVCGALVAGCLSGSGGAQITPVQKMELETLSAQLADPGRSANTKLDAASLLLGRTYPGAAEALEAFLRDTTNPSARIAVAEAIAARGMLPQEFIDPLAAMVRGAEPSVRAPAAKALAACRSPEALKRLIGVARDTKAPAQIRLAAIGALERAFDREAIGALVDLLADRDPAVRRASLAALPVLTNMDFGEAPSQWRRWWDQNKDKSWSQWLGDWSAGLAKRNGQLIADNAELRARLARAMDDLYSAAPAAQKDELLIGFLKDSVGEVRLVGARLVDRRISAGQPVAEAIRLQMRVLLADPDARLRRQAALGLANMRDEEAVGLLLKRLQREEVSDVRVSVFTALGQLSDSGSLEAVIAEIGGEQSVAASAAAALAQIASKNLLDDDTRQRAFEVLTERYRQTPDEPDKAPLREALLTAMGSVGGQESVSVLRAALADSAGTVRLAAVNSLAKLGTNEAADWIAPLLADSDRGVRQAAILAIGDKAGLQHLDAIMQRTDERIEGDEAVRQQAWQVAKKILQQADADTLSELADDLQGRQDASGRRIEVLQMLVEAVRATGGQQSLSAMRRLGQALVEAGRPAEAAGCLADAYGLALASDGAEAEAIWCEWIEALLAADDPAAVKEMAKKNDPELFARSLALLQKHLSQRIKQAEFSDAILLASEALNQLPERLSFEQREQIDQILTEARDHQRAADQQTVRKLVSQLAGQDESARNAASEQLQGMGERAAGPLLEALVQAVTGEKADPQVERAILGILRTVAPKLTGYDVDDPVDERLKLIESWGKQL